MELTEVQVGCVLTRTGGYLRGVSSHSLQPYRGCTLGSSLCGAGCYVQHNNWITRSRPWGAFLEVRINAADSYLRHVGRERRWANRRGEDFAVFMSSSTDPFVPQERHYRVTRSILEAMIGDPPDRLIFQTHSHQAREYAGLLRQVAQRCDTRFHISIESDREQLPGLPPSASSVRDRLLAAGQMRQHGVPTVLTIAPLLPFDDPDSFFAQACTVADAVVIDHWIGGDGSSDGRRTRKTSLPTAIGLVSADALDLKYRDQIADCARRYFEGRVGLGPAGFAGIFDRPLT